MLPPGIRSGELPPFHKLPDDTFQDLCRDLFDAEAEITICEVYGTRGQKQHGIDLIAHRDNGIEVGQCKCCEKFTSSDIRKASDVFFESWHHWKAKDVRRFVLFVACDLSSRQQQDEIIAQIERFKAYGISYEAWSASKIRNKLRPCPCIVSTYLDPAEHWVNVICGSPLPATAGRAPESVPSATLRLLAGKVEQQAVWISEDVEHQLEAMRKAWREGRAAEATEWLYGFKNDAERWAILDPQVQAKLLCFEAITVIQFTGDTNEASRLIDQAHNLSPSNYEARVRAWIAAHENGLEAALTILNDLEDIDSIHLRAAFLLEAGRIDECRATLQLDVVTQTSAAETQRLHALLHLITKDIPQARFCIQKALELEPQWEDVQFTAAVINYYNALSPAMLPGYLPAWPEPVEWIFVKQDDESRVTLRTAAEMFQQLAANPADREGEHPYYATWFLACLANDPDRQEEAINYCQHLLEANTTDYRAIAWAVARKFDIDLALSERALHRQLNKNAVTIPLAFALIHVYLASQPSRVKKALGLLKSQRIRSLFQAQNAEEAWTSLHIQLLAMKGDNQALTLANNSSTSGWHLYHARSEALRLQAQKTGDWQPLIAHLEHSYAETGDTIFFFDCCQIMAQQHQWDYVADRAEQLNLEVATGAALGLGATAAYQSKQFTHCVTLLDTHRHLFSQHKLPPELRRLRVRCQQALGNLTDALTELEMLAQENPTLAHFLDLIEILFQKGDLKQLVIVARKINSYFDIGAEQRLRLSLLVHVEDRNLAATFWRKAVERGLSDEFLSTAINLGYRLGLDPETRHLMNRAMQLAQQGQRDIFQMDIRSLLSLLQQQREVTREHNEAYFQGTIPIHVLAEWLHRPLVEFYHSALALNEAEPNPQQQYPLFIRHGSRLLMNGFPEVAPQWRLCIDITALLLAAHLDILDQVERAFQPLAVPADMLVALRQMYDNLCSHQPSRLESFDQIVDLVERGRLHVIETVPSSSDETNALVAELGSDWVAVFEQARYQGGCLVTFLPLRRKDQDGILGDEPPQSLPDDAYDYIINCRAIADSLNQYGALSGDKFKTVLDSLGTEGIPAKQAGIPKIRTALFCHANIPEVLASSGLLDTACNYFQVYIEQDDLHQARAVLQNHRQSQKTLAWLSALSDRIRQGLDEGVYTIIPFTATNESPLEKEFLQSPTMRCLLALLQYTGSHEGTVIWTDDRYLNGHSHWNQIPTVGIVEVLKALVAHGSLTDSDYYEALHRLRAANARFLPVQKDDILYHIQQAPIENENGNIVETPPLAMLRRYIAVCLTQAHVLQPPSNSSTSPDSPGEFIFLAEIIREVLAAIGDVWVIDTPEDICRTRAEWLLQNLFFDHLAADRLLPLEQSDRNRDHLVALGIIGFLFQEALLKADPESRTASLRQSYHDWLFNRVFARRFEADPQLIPLVADRVKLIITDLLDNIPDAPSLLVAKAMLGNYVQSFPETLSQELKQDTDFMAHLGIQTVLRITVANMQFVPDAFFQAATEVVNGQKANITTADTDHILTMYPCENYPQDGTLYLHYPKDDTRIPFHDKRLQLLRKSAIEREKLLRQHRHWVDCADEQFDQVIAEIVSIAAPRERFERFSSWYDTSAAVFYADLWQHLKSQAPLYYQDFQPPSGEGLVRHYRLISPDEPNEKFSETLNTAAQTLITQEGLYEALVRLIGLPIPIPKPIIDSLAALSPTERRILLKQGLKQAPSPVSRFHVLHLLVCFRDDTPAYTRLVRRITASLSKSEAAETFSAFHILLRWVYETFNRWPDARDWTPQIRLAVTWVHTHRLFTTFISIGTTEAWIKETFTQPFPTLPSEIIQSNSESRFDAAHPNHVHWLSFLIHGLYYSVKDFDDSSLREMLRAFFDQEAFTEPVDGKRAQVPKLRQDVRQLRNGIASFLHGDLGEKIATLWTNSDEVLPPFLPPSVAVEPLIQALLEDTESLELWYFLGATYPGIPLPIEVTQMLSSFLRQICFASLLQKNRDLGIITLQVASLQLVHLKDENVYHHLKDQIITCAKLLAEEARHLEGEKRKNLQDADNFSSVHVALIEAARNISISPTIKQEAATEFNELLTRLVDHLPEIRSICRQIVQYMIDNLPLHQAEQFWPLLIRLRAE